LKELIGKVRNRRGDDIEEEDESPIEKLNKFKR
jgi:hypothetical protein